jgi:hypothetical protein
MAGLTNPYTKKAKCAYELIPSNQPMRGVRTCGTLP